MVSDMPMQSLLLTKIPAPAHPASVFVRPGSPRRSTQAPIQAPAAHPEIRVRISFLVSSTGMGWLLRGGADPAGSPNGVQERNDIRAVKLLVSVGSLYEKRADAPCLAVVVVVDTV